MTQPLKRMWSIDRNWRVSARQCRGLLVGAALATGCWTAPAAPVTPTTTPVPVAPSGPPRMSFAIDDVCGDGTYGWEEIIQIRLQFSEEAYGEISAVGDIDFNNGDISFRQTKAALRGMRDSGKLRGKMTEVLPPEKDPSDTPTKWKIRMDFSIDETDRVMRGEFTEVLDDNAGEDLMCRFTWKLPAR